jgi:CelD/BcsL family acetyltransferase involved in cellulose biosynthesis
MKISLRSCLKSQSPHGRVIIIAASSNFGRSTVYKIHPLEDSRWEEFLQRHPCASTFHATEWLRALHQTYGYEPSVYTTSPPGSELQNGLVTCRVNSWLTGNRFVSVPFSDHCEPLVDDPEVRADLFSALEQQLRKEKLSYTEFRPRQRLEHSSSLFRSNHIYCFHELDLRAPLEALFRNFHKDSVQRKIRRAERERLTYQDGRSEELLDSFYHLFLLTRVRHKVPPPPKKWFQSLIDSFGQALTIRIAAKQNQPVAAILTIQYKKTLLYKYGCSDVRFNSLGGTQMLFWRSIQVAKEQGLSVFDLGRSDKENAGLITFKDRWGSARSDLIYSRFTTSTRSRDRYVPAGTDWQSQITKQLLTHAPSRAFAMIGKLFYRHIG